MRPYIICHMLSSIDGRIDGAALDAVIAGRRSLPTVFDGIDPKRKKALALNLVSVEKRKGGTLCVRYKMK